MDCDGRESAIHQWQVRGHVTDLKVEDDREVERAQRIEDRFALRHSQAIWGTRATDQDCTGVVEPAREPQAVQVATDGGGVVL